MGIIQNIGDVRDKFYMYYIHTYIWAFTYDIEKPTCIYNSAYHRDGATQMVVAFIPYSLTVWWQNRIIMTLKTGQLLSNQSLSSWATSKLSKWRENDHL